MILDVDLCINAALDPLHELVVLSQPLSKAAAEVSTSKSDPIDFDNEIAEGIAHLDVFSNPFHKVDFPSFARCSRNRLPVLATITSESANDGGDKDLGISDDWIANNVAFQTSSPHDVWQQSVPNYCEKSASLTKPKAWSAPSNT